MRTEFTAIDPSGIEADYRLEAETPPSREELARLFREVGLTPAPDGLIPEAGAVLGRVVPPTTPPATSAELCVICGADAGTTIPLTNGVTTVGRDEHCTLTLTDPGVSRQHLEFEVSPRRIMVRQLAVTNRARLDGERIVEPTAVPSGGLIRIANTVLRISESAGHEMPESTGAPTVIVFPAVPGRRAHPYGLSAVLVSCVAGTVAAGVMRSVELLVMAALPALGLVAVTLGSRSSHRRTRRRGERDFRAAQALADQALAQACASETAQRHRTLPDPDRLASHVPADVPKLDIRLGLGRAPAALEVRRDGVQSTHPLLRDVPIGADLADGVLAFCGPATLARAQARWALCQLADRRGIAVSLWLSCDAEAEWTWARWLPQLCDVYVGDATPPPPAQHSGTRVLVIDHPLVDVRDAELPALVVTGNPRVPAIAAQATVPTDDTGLSQVFARAGLDPIRFTPDLVSLDFAERWARRLAGSWEAASSDSQVPTGAALLELLDLGAAPDPTTIAGAWEFDPSSLRTPIGVAAAGTVEIDLDSDGPHALIAGTTGSGKSELLQTIVLGLAARYRPEAVQFLLVDYKGGAAFGRCTDLPHTAGVVTDLDALQTTRALRSLRAELRRRELLLGSAAAADFATFHRLEKDASIPRLVVVVDEFAALVADLPDFVTGLVGIAQRGRSLGMHLVLATQRPAGVVSPEIRANTNLRIALRTISTAESIDVIDRPDAAELDPAVPGRAIRGGMHHDHFQVARVNGVSVRRVSPGSTLTRLGPWRRPLAEPQAADGDPVSDADLLVTQLIAAAHLAGARTPPPPWLAPLVDEIPAATLTASEPTSLAIGMVDLPDEQRQEPLTLDLEAGGSFAVGGGPRSGRSTVLRTVATSAATRHSTDELHLHILDFGGGALRSLVDLPHLGTALDARDPSAAVTTLVAYLERVIGSRRTTEARAPRIVVLIDDWVALSAALDVHDAGATSERLRHLLPRCHGTGVTVLLTGDRSVLQPRMGSVVDERFALAFSDPSEYALVGITQTAVPDAMRAGRGVRLRDEAEIQFALPVPRDASGCPDPGPTTVADRIEVRPLPGTLASDSLPRRRGHVCLGLGGDAAEPVWLNLDDYLPSLLVAGPRRSGRTNLLCSLFEQALAITGSVAVLAPERSALYVLAAHHERPIVTDPEDIDDHDIVLVDDADMIEPGSLTEAVERRLRSGPGGVIIATRTDAALTAFRGPIAELRRAGHGIVLQPDTLDGELLGVRLGRPDLGGPAGRGVAVGDPAWGWPQPFEHPSWLSIQTSASP